jgi:hypothetical protein
MVICFSPLLHPSLCKLLHLFDKVVLPESGCVVETDMEIEVLQWPLSVEQLCQLLEGGIGREADIAKWLGDGSLCGMGVVKFEKNVHSIFY